LPPSLQPGAAMSLEDAIPLALGRSDLAPPD
jgi:hypothetical protein